MHPFRVIYDRLPASIRSTVRRVVPDTILHWYAQKNTDVYLISYPKCGRTWLRLMIGHAITGHYNLPENEENLFLRWKTSPSPEIPRIKVIHDDRPMLRTPDELEESKKRYKGKRVILLVRDPRDVVVSSFYEMKNRAHLFGENPYEERKAEFDGSLTEFIYRDQGGFRTILRFYNIWAENMDMPDGLFLVRYENIVANPEKELRGVIDFLGLTWITDQTVAEAVEFASFDNMRRMEMEGEFNSGILNPADRSNIDSYKTRKGKVQGYLESVPQAEIDFMNQQIRENLSPFFGYST